MKSDDFIAKGITADCAHGIRQGIAEPVVGADDSVGPIENTAGVVWAGRVARPYTPC